MENKINYQKQTDKLIAEFQSVHKVPHLLLHSCCAPCSSYVIEYLSSYFHITVLYYNPNIYPQREYDFRKAEQQRLISQMPTKFHVEFMQRDYNSDEFFDVCKGLEKCKEGGERCRHCFNLRLNQAALAAKEIGAEYFATTLTVSPLKNPQLINEIGEEAAQKHNVKYLPSDFKKKNGYKRTIELSKEYNLYRQNYCGCIFSYKEMMERTQQNKQDNKEK